MVRVLAVNNYPTTERFERLKKCLEENGASVTSIPWSEASTGRFDNFDGAVLSGSPDMMSEERARAKFSTEIDAIKDSRVPVLGVCFGHQMIAVAFGSQVVKDRQHVLKFVETEVLASDRLFNGLPRSLMLLESRDEVVRSLPEGFELLARSETSPVAAIKHRSRTLYGVQSHPERYSQDHPEGRRVLGNFVELLR